jgi:UDP-glucose 4-epimerase
VIYKKSATRDYVFVDDVVSANVLSLTKGRNETVNLSTGIETSNQKVYQLLSKAFQWKAKPVYKPARNGEVARSCLSPKKAKKVLGWTPKVLPEEGVLSLIK